ncbi:uncharacterized protein LOC129600374 [Paramacrobiotus metropolitanus]|uniref:uncharacterized protein LOC129600374 n=1 Tax=Paramacrobiotus metropolitanus TaxID=2943436 RepID=UPI0024456117|nr:uncharacterized protein LOC129600374 [Paramacrobiotus metropolitanus]
MSDAAGTNRSTNSTVRNATIPKSLFAFVRADFDAFFIFTLVICSVGTILFALLLATLLNQRKLFHGSRYLIMNQLVVEMLLLGFHLPAAVIGAYDAEIHNSMRVFFNESFCFWQTFLFKSAIASSMWGLFALALNRLIAVWVRTPGQYEYWSRPSIQWAQVIFIWVIGFACQLYFALWSYAATFAAIFPLRQCRTYGTVSLDVGQSLGIYVPLAGTALVYMVLIAKLLAHKLRKKRGTVQVGQQPAPDKTMVNRRILLAKVLCTTAFIHCVAFLLYPVFNMANGGRPVGTPVTGLWFRTAFHIGQLSTPITFFVMSHDCRKALKRLLHLGRQEEDSHTYMSGATGGTGHSHSGHKKLQHSHGTAKSDTKV